jgi:hypothetical protein
MRSGGFSLGKKQAGPEQSKRTTPPNGSDLFQLLGQAQKAPEKVFTYCWQSPGSSAQFTLTVINSKSAQRGDRQGWNSSAIDHGAIGDGEWRLVKEDERGRAEVFQMRSSDADLIRTLVDEALLPENSMPEQALPEDPAQGMGHEVSKKAWSQSLSPQLRASGSAPPDPSAKPASTLPYLDGNLRSTNVRTLVESFHSHSATGRLIVDIGTIQAEVFFTNGEPVHAKSCHSIYQDRDTIGDAVLVDLLTWREGDFKFNQDWPAASKSITSSLQAFLDGLVVIAPPAPPAEAAPPTPPAPSPMGTSNAPMAPSAPSAPAPAAQFSAPSSGIPLTRIADPDDFATVDQLVAETYSRVLDTTGTINYGLFLMLTRSEFVRFEHTRIPFCFATISLGLTESQATDEVLRKIVECFEVGCQPLDIAAYATHNRMFALFPLCTSDYAGRTLKYFFNSLGATQLAENLHGSNIKITLGLSEVPRDGVEFQQIFEHACKLRRLQPPPAR